MNPDFPQLFAALRASPRLEGFQGVHVNSDLSVVVIDRWRGLYFPSFAALEAWVNRRAPAPQPEGNPS